MDNLELIILVAVVLVIVLLVLPSSCNVNHYDDDPSERFTAIQEIDTTATIPDGIDPNGSDKGLITPMPNSKNFESLIYDPITQTIQTGSQFMDTQGLVTPPFVSPAWSPDSYGPSSKSEMDPADYENDPRMLYN